jgi:uncharacterized protein with PhoU and TrkA domain
MVTMFQLTGSLTKYPARAPVLWYAGIIAAGAILLWMPVCHSGSGHPFSALDAVFTSTSATCVTGLVVRSTEEHGKILKSLGVERVVFPEAEIAQDLGNELTWPNIIDYLPINPDYSFVEIVVPDSYQGRTMQELNLRRRFGVWVVGVKNALTGELEMFPDGEYQFGADQMLLVVGKQEDLSRLRDAK